MIEPTTSSSAGWKQRKNPFLETLHLPPVTFADGIARLEFTIEEIHLRHGGVAHGGLYAAVIDTVAGYTAYTVSPGGSDLVTIQLNLNMTGTAKLGDRIVATSEVAHAGRRTAVIQVEVRRHDGKLLAIGSVTLFFVTEGLTKAQ
jgi:uncharacterized protein (TIGR00369 family)